ncbi:GlxA family transcriptional regulator [Nitrospirillum sp. BR 11828]|uniref:GlxA family transcriptional regulator n=1 Tax=Nitrospirillum sp. BR 11828 TaxID=3104325 RepID=UPI002ACA1001|nr:GlxA family transcriptional regulator [Nitrospirillum sp. BR 11828]MDZ5645765.1 GlxA family transcriptional regulator [Nitrospirillum sp. BR 11828]
MVGDHPGSMLRKTPRRHMERDGRLMHTVGLILAPGFQVMNLAVAAAFEQANTALPKPAYSVSFLSEAGGEIPSSVGLAVRTAAIGDPSFDTIFSIGAFVHPATSPTPSRGMRSFLRQAAAGARRLVAPCTGAFLLAEAGVLDGRRATTHWAHAADLQHRYPKVRVQADRIFVSDDNIWTSAGMSATVDLALALIEQDLGPDICQAVARHLVLYHRRPGGQPQLSALLDLPATTDRIQRVLAYARGNLARELSVEALADIARLSPRQFSRLFHRETGLSPGKAVEGLRLDAARALLADGRRTLDDVAHQTGFADRERMRRAFLRRFGHGPQAVRRPVQQVGA